MSGGAAGGGFGGSAGMAGNGVTPTFTNVQTIFTTSCALSTSCHKGSRPKADLNLEPGMAYMNLLGGDAMGQLSCEFPAMRRVVPGRPDNSLLIAKLTTPPPGPPSAMCTSSGGMNNRDPQFNDALPADQLSLIRNWISGGARP